MANGKTGSRKCGAVERGHGARGIEVDVRVAAVVRRQLRRGAGTAVPVPRRIVAGRMAVGAAMDLVCTAASQRGEVTDSVPAGDRVDPQQRPVGEDARERGPRERTACPEPGRRAGFRRVEAAAPGPDSSCAVVRTAHTIRNSVSQPSARAHRARRGMQPRISGQFRLQGGRRQRVWRLTGRCRRDGQPPFGLLGVVADSHAVESRGEPDRPRDRTAVSSRRRWRRRSSMTIGRCFRASGPWDRLSTSQTPCHTAVMPAGLPGDRVDVAGIDGVDVPRRRARCDSADSRRW